MFEAIFTCPANDTVLSYSLQSRNMKVSFYFLDKGTIYLGGRAVFSELLEKKKISSLQMNYKWQLVQFSQGLNIIELG